MDREKVRRALRICSVQNDVGCQGCPYFEERKTYGHEWCTTSMAQDALAMLKEQEEVEPTLIREGRNKHYSDYVCPRCDNEVAYEQNYCSECGAQFLWEVR